MLNLAAMSDEEFCVPVRPPVPQTPARVVINEKGLVSLNGKLAEKFANRPVRLCFNQAGTAIQIACTRKKDPLNIVFPKNGRKRLPDARELLMEKRIAFPAIFTNEAPTGGEVWRGALNQPAPPPQAKKVPAPEHKLHALTPTAPAGSPPMKVPADNAESLRKVFPLPRLVFGHTP